MVIMVEIHDYRLMRSPYIPRWNHKTKLIFGGGTAVIKSTEADLKRFGTIII